MAKVVRDRPFLVPEDVMQILGCKRAAAYKVIRKLNGELADKGLIVLRGRVSRRYFQERFGLV